MEVQPAMRVFINKIALCLNVTVEKGEEQNPIAQD